jgi:thymidylate synthase
MKPNNANQTYKELLTDIIEHGQDVRVRGLKCKELITHETVVPMTAPVVTLLNRKLSHKFMATEAHWILTGDNKVAPVAREAKSIANYSDDGMFFNGAYGPEVISQITYICDMLLKDKSTRQAVMTIWRKNPRDSKDIPCTVSIQFIIREDKLHVIDNMRSSDAWLGWPYDIFNFSMLGLYVYSILKERGFKDKLELGNIHLLAVSQHLYEKDIEKAKSVLATDEFIDYAVLDANEFIEPESVIKKLKSIAAGVIDDVSFFNEVVAEW